MKYNAAFLLASMGLVTGEPILLLPLMTVILSGLKGVESDFTTKSCNKAFADWQAQESDGKYISARTGGAWINTCGIKNVPSSITGIEEETGKCFQSFWNYTNKYGPDIRTISQEPLSDNVTECLTKLGKGFEKYDGAFLTDFVAPLFGIFGVILIAWMCLCLYDKKCKNGSDANTSSVSPSKYGTV